MTSKKKLRRQRDEWKDAYENQLECHMRWQCHYYRLKKACEGAIEEAAQEQRDHLAQFAVGGDQ